VEEDVVVTISHHGYVKRNPATLYRSQHRGGRGKVGMGTKEDDFVERIFVASTHSYVLCFTNTGRVHWLKVHQIPQAGRAAKGKAIVNLIGISSKERVTAVLSVQDFVNGKFVFFATKNGITKKTDLLAYSHPRAGGIIAITLDEEDDLISVKLTDGTQDVFLGTKTGKAIRFSEKDVRSSGRTARGVTGIRMGKEDEVIGMEILGDGNSIVTISENGYGKRTEVTEYRAQARGGRGTINLKTVPKIGLVSGIRQVVGNEDVMLISDAGKIIRMRVDEISLLHRSTQGVKLIELDSGETLIGLARAEGEDEERKNNIEDDDV
jgi:DNA gyrase subunit A